MRHVDNFVTISSHKSFHCSHESNFEVGGWFVIIVNILSIGPYASFLDDFDISLFESYIFKLNKKYIFITFENVFEDIFAGLLPEDILNIDMTSESEQQIWIVRDHTIISHWNK